MKRLLVVLIVTVASGASLWFAGGIKAAPEDTLDHFLLYRASADEARDVSLEDYLTEPDSKLYNVGEINRLGVPASKEGSLILDPDTHLTVYRIELAPEEQPVRPKSYFVTNQFGTLQVQVREPDHLMLPAAKSLTGPEVTPLDPNHEVDHYVCYDIVPQGEFEKFSVLVEDQFTNPAKFIKVTYPARLCTPVISKDGLPIIKHPDVHLLCYTAKLAAQYEDPNEDIRAALVADQFNESRRIHMTTITPRTFCVPSEVTGTQPEGDGQ